MSGSTLEMKLLLTRSQSFTGLLMPGTVSQTEWAYIGGLFDGEGSVLLNKTGTYRSLRVEVTSTSEELVEFLLASVGGTTMYRAPRQTHHRPSFVWRLHGPAAFAFLKDVLPHLKENSKIARSRMILEEFADLAVSERDDFVRRFHATRS